MKKLRRPFIDFETWWKEQIHEDFLSDLNRLAGYLYMATSKRGRLDPEVQKELSQKLVKKIERRLAKCRWDGRQWRGVEPLRKRLQTSYES